MKLGMSPCVHPLINEHSHVLASDSKNGLSKYICADQHMTPQTTANLLLCCIWCQRKLLIEYLETVTVSEITTCCWESHFSHLVCSLSLYWLSHHERTRWSHVGGGELPPSSSKDVSTRMVCLMIRPSFFSIHSYTSWIAEPTGIFRIPIGKEQILSLH